MSQLYNGKCSIFVSLLYLGDKLIFPAVFVVFWMIFSSVSSAKLSLFRLITFSPYPPSSPTQQDREHSWEAGIMGGEKQQKIAVSALKRVIENTVEKLGLWVGRSSKNETGSRSPCMRPRSDLPKMKNSTPDKIVAEKKESNEANWMVSNSAKLDCRTKQHTQFGVSASNGSRDMARTKSWQKQNKKNNEANWMVSNSAKLDRRAKQHTQFGVSAINGSRDMARTKAWQKKKINKKITKQIGW